MMVGNRFLPITKSLLTANLFSNHSDNHDQHCIFHYSALARAGGIRIPSQGLIVTDSRWSIGSLLEFVLRAGGRCLGRTRGGGGLAEGFRSLSK